MRAFVQPLGVLSVLTRRASERVAGRRQEIGQELQERSTKSHEVTRNKIRLVLLREILWIAVKLVVSWVSGVQSTDFSRGFCEPRKSSTNVGTLNT
jgi:hypothetical protein